jgi:hypothetical protein
VTAARNDVELAGLVDMAAMDEPACRQTVPKHLVERHLPEERRQRQRGLCASFEDDEAYQYR